MADTRSTRSHQTSSTTNRAYIPLLLLFLLFPLKVEPLSLFIRTTWLSEVPEPVWRSWFELIKQGRREGPTSAYYIEELALQNTAYVIGSPHSIFTILTVRRQQATSFPHATPDLTNRLRSSTPHSHSLTHSLTMNFFCRCCESHAVPANGSDFKALGCLGPKCSDLGLAPNTLLTKVKVCTTNMVSVSLCVSLCLCVSVSMCDRTMSSNLPSANSR